MVSVRRTLTESPRAQVMTWTGGVIVVGAALYPLLQTARSRGWCEFAGAFPICMTCQLM